MRCGRDAIFFARTCLSPELRTDSTAPLAIIAAMPAAPDAAPLPLRTATIRVGLVEDDATTRAILESAITGQADMQLVLQAASRQQALALLPRAPLDVLLVDLGLPDGSGLDVITAARRQWPECSVLVSTIFGDEMHVLPSIEAGAMGYLLKDASAPGLVDEIRSVHAGGSPISPMVARKILARTALRQAPREPGTTDRPALAAYEQQAAPAPRPAVTLSPREHEVLLRVSKGFTAEETAHALGVSPSTVLTFVRRIYAKLEVNTRAEAILEAQRHGILLQ